jgi:hypothetical protein
MMDSGKKKIFGLQFLVNILLVMDVVVLVAIREVTASMDGDLKLNEIIHSSVSVMITPVKILRFNSSTTTLPPNATADYDKTGVYCSLTIHRNDCGNPRISYDELITWDTRVCFRWNCARVKTAAVPKKGGKNSETTKSMGFQPPPVKDFAIRVQNCWTGSPNEPIFLIDKNGYDHNHYVLYY